MSRNRWFKFLAVIMFLSVSYPAVAHEPYYTQIEKLETLDRRDLHIKLLHGDGIFFADPIRAIVVNSAGKLMAVSPMSLAMLIDCKSTEPELKCLVYDQLRSLIYSVNKDELEETILAEKDGKPEFYPEYGQWRPNDYAFDIRKASFFEITRFEIFNILNSPIKSFFAFCWGSFVMLNFMLLFVKLKANSWRIKNVTIFGTIRVIVHTCLIFLLILVSFYYRLLDPYSIYYLFLNLMFGLAFVVFLVKPHQA